MGVDHPGNGKDGKPENVDKPSTGGPRHPLPDQPGSPGQKSRIASWGGVMGSVDTVKKPAERDDEQQADDDQVGEETDESAVEEPTEIQPPGSSSDQPSEEDAEDERGDDASAQSQPKAEGGSQEASEGDPIEEFLKRPATYEVDGRKFGYRTWGEEFAARRTSREAMLRENASLEKQDESSGKEQPPPEEAKSSADKQATDGKSPGSGDASKPAAKAGEGDDPAAGDGASEADEPEADGQGVAWREHSDAMRAKWAALESEYAPDQPPEGNDQGKGPPAEGAGDESGDRSGDEPGAWRGDGNQYLNYEENYAVGRAFERVRNQETDVTDKLQTRETEVADADLVGLEYRLKGEDRFKEKAAEQLAAELREDPTRAAESISDALRYTYQIPADMYTQGYQEITEKLAEDGFEMVFSRNSWHTPVYKGVNTRWKTPGGQLFEVQFHTPESFEAKQLTHAAYERRRSPQVGELEAEKLDDFQREVSAGIPIPKNVSDIASFRKEE